MSIFSYHLIKIPYSLVLKGLFSNPLPKNTKGLIHSENMTAMTLGSPIFSTSRILLRQVAIFAQWKNEKALDDYLDKNKFGKLLAKGWHIRLSYLRKWGEFSDFQIPDKEVKLENINSPVVAITIAKMKPFEVPRFISWGRPVEKLVRDHPATTLSLASYKFPNTVSTFSIWQTETEMTNMVHGHSALPKPKRHVHAMKERKRRNFHFEFTTLRFKPISEFGSWKGQRNFIPFRKEESV